ncbi:MAG: MFS transporter [Candidatus Lokiarchaeota archaeon]|nr:MFS transporter [Candidatus Lokiarchaeota archaeon]
MNPLEKGVKSSKVEDTNTKKMIMFSLGYFFNAFMIVAFNNYVWTYYEGELGLINITALWPIYLAIANVIFTIWSMVTNPLIGYLTNKPMKWTRKRGFHSPWIIISGVPTIILFLLLFTPPIVMGFESVLPILIYYLVISCLYDTAYSLFQIHSFGAFPAHFRGDLTRRKAGAITQVFTFSANFFVIMIWSQIIILGDKTSFTIAAFVSTICLAVSLVIFIPGSKESDEIKERFILGYETTEKMSFLSTLKMAIKQKNFMLVIVAYLSFMIALGLTSMNAVYFVDAVLQEEQDIRTIGSLFMVCSSFLTMPLWIRVAKKIGHSRAFTIGLIFMGVSYLLYLFIIDVIGFYLASILNGIAFTMYLIMLSPIFADSYDEITVKTKKHHETTLVGIRNSFIRISLTIQSFIIAIIHTITVYNPNDPIHSREALLGLRLIQGLFPFIFCLIGALIFYKWFDLKGKKKQDIMKKLQEMGL